MALFQRLRFGVVLVPPGHAAGELCAAGVKRVTAAGAVGRLDPHGADNALPAVPLGPVNGCGLAVYEVGQVLLGSGSEWLLAFGCVDTAQTDLLDLAALGIEAGDGVAVRYAGDLAFQRGGEGRVRRATEGRGLCGAWRILAHVKSPARCGAYDFIRLGSREPLLRLPTLGGDRLREGH